MRSDFQALIRVHAAYKAASLAFPAEGASIKEMSPEAAPAALDAEGEAADHAQVSSAPAHFCPLHPVQTSAPPASLDPRCVESPCSPFLSMQLKSCM